MTESNFQTLETCGGQFLLNEIFACFNHWSKSVCNFTIKLILSITLALHILGVTSAVMQYGYRENFTVGIPHPNDVGN